MAKSIAMLGANVWYCGHKGYFIADIIGVEDVYVIRANTAVTDKTLIRDSVKEEATHHLNDFPGPNFWRPDLGVFVVPKNQLKLLAPGKEQIKEREERRAGLVKQSQGRMKR